MTHAASIAEKVSATFTTADFLDEGRAARIAAQRHLASLPAWRREQLRREWLAAEADVDAASRPTTFTPERWAELNEQWNDTAAQRGLLGEM